MHRPPAHTTRFFPCISMLVSTCIDSALPFMEGRELFGLAVPAMNYSSQYKGQIESRWLLW